jgi:hypothetical protein
MKCQMYQRKKLYRRILCVRSTQICESNSRAEVTIKDFRNSVNKNENN